MNLPGELLAKVHTSKALSVGEGQTFLLPASQQELYVLESLLNYISHQP